MLILPGESVKEIRKSNRKGLGKINSNFADQEREMALQRLGQILRGTKEHDLLGEQGPCSGWNRASLLHSRARGLSVTTEVIQSIPLSGNQQL